MRYWTKIEEAVEGPFEESNLKYVDGFTAETLVSPDDPGAGDSWSKASDIGELKRVLFPAPEPQTEPQAAPALEIQPAGKPQEPAAVPGIQPQDETRIPSVVQPEPAAEPAAEKVRDPGKADLDPTALPPEKSEPAQPQPQESQTKADQEPEPPPEATVVRPPTRVVISGGGARREVHLVKGRVRNYGDIHVSKNEDTVFERPVSSGGVIKGRVEIRIARGEAGE